MIAKLIIIGALFCLIFVACELPVVDCPVIDGQEALIRITTESVAVCGYEYAENTENTENTDAGTPECPNAPGGWVLNLSHELSNKNRLCLYSNAVEPTVTN